MKRIFLLVSFALSATILFSQAKKNIGGKDLYLKGSCERVSVKFVSCTYCTDKELTNCKEYWCTDDGTCTEAPKKNQGRELSVSQDNENIATKFKETDTTSKLPKGLTIRNGVIHLKEGYVIKEAANGKYKTILSAQGLGGMGGTVGGFVCICKEDGGFCSVTIVGSSLHCACGEYKGCRVIVTTDESPARTVKEGKDTPAPENGWKEFIMPATNR